MAGAIPPVVLGPNLLRYVNHFFLNLDFTPSCLVMALRLALLLHHRHSTAPLLAPLFQRADWPALDAALSHLPIASLIELLGDSMPLAASASSGRSRSRDRAAQSRTIRSHVSRDRAAQSRTLRSHAWCLSVARLRWVRLGFETIWSLQQGDSPCPCPCT